jgi:hypothetical protein
VNRRVALVLAAGSFVLAVPVAAARAATTCDAVVEQLRLESQRGADQSVMRATAQEHPECKSAIAAAAQEARANLKAPGADATGFLGPIGWLWNNVYYRVYQGNLVMMFIFGWALFLAPVLTVVCAYLVMRGATNAFHRPTAVPPAALSTRD